MDPLGFLGFRPYGFSGSGFLCFRHRVVFFFFLGGGGLGVPQRGLGFRIILRAISRVSKRATVRVWGLAV